MDNRGFGLRIMLFFCIVFISLIIVVTSIVNTNFKSLAREKGTKSKYSYFDLEIKMVKAATNYSNKMYSTSIRENTEVGLNLKTLKNSNYLTTIKDPYNNKECSGYVILKKGRHNIQYIPYLKCGTNYKTIGYDVKYE